MNKKKILIITGITLALGVITFIIIKMKGKKTVFETPLGAKEVIIKKDAGDNIKALEAGTAQTYKEAGLADPMGALGFRFESGAILGTFVKTIPYRDRQAVVFSKDGGTYATLNKTNAATVK